MFVVIKKATYSCTFKAEYIVAASSACQGIWLTSLLNHMHILLKGSLKIFIDNNLAINLAKNPVAHGRSKHIDIRSHFLRDLIKKKKIELKFCNTEDKVADILTKPLKFDTFEKLRKMLGISTLQNQD